MTADVAVCSYKMESEDVLKAVHKCSAIVVMLYQSSFPASTGQTTLAHQRQQLGWGSQERIQVSRHGAVVWGPHSDQGGGGGAVVCRCGRCLLPNRTAAVLK